MVEDKKEFESADITPPLEPDRGLAGEPGEAAEPGPKKKPLDPDRSVSSQATSVDESGRAEIIPISRVICPHLGLNYDATVVAAGPSHDHVCYAQKRRLRPDLAYQKLFCLGGRFASCEHYVEIADSDTVAAYPSSQMTGSISKAALVWSVLAALVLVLAGLGFTYRHDAIAAFEMLERASTNQDKTAAIVLSTTTAGAMATPSAPSPTPPGDVADQQPAVQLPVNLIPTVTPDAEDVILSPQSTDVGWWTSGEGSQRAIGDSFLYAGRADELTYVSAIRFDLSRIARGAPIPSGALRLTGIRDDRLGEANEASWLLQFVAENELAEFPAADYGEVSSAPASITLSPVLGAEEVSVGRTNEWTLDSTAREWLYQQVLDGSTSIVVRIAPFQGTGEGLFAWDSGRGSESNGNLPQLVLAVGAPPPTPPPTATRPILVATFTPEPDNVLTVVARNATSTAVASNPGTPTPTPVTVVTPTPFPANLATLQAAAAAEGLPGVVLHTPVPVNNATATENAAYATAVALTTGTFTPVPTGYVTPALIYPSPPPENVATAAARAVVATAAAQRNDPTATLPWNAVLAEYVYATDTPGNAETAVAQIQEQNAAIAATGTPTPTPWNLVIITRVPQPSPTPLPLVVDATTIPPTPTPTPTRDFTAADLDRFRNRILFKSDRSGQEEVWVMDPTTGEVLSLVTDSRIHELASEQFLAYSPDRKERAFVQPGGSGELQIFIESIEYGSVRQLTDLGNTLGVINYDPAWSPAGDRIAFVSNVSSGDEVYTVGIDGQNLQRLTENTWEWDKHPTWSPDGTQIVFYSNRDTRLRQIWIMNADGSEQRNLSYNEYNDWDPVWIP